MKYSDKIINAFTLYTRTVDLVNATGLSKQTIIKYKKDPGLQSIISDIRQQTLRDTVNRLHNELYKSIDTLAKIRDNEEVNAQTRVYCANCLINHCKEWTLAVDVIDRLENLEELTKEKGA